MNWRWIILTAFLAALAVGYSAFTNRGAAPVASGVAERPTYFLRNAVITETQTDGSLAMQLSAARIQMTPVSDDLAMETVQVNYHQSPAQQWRLTAERGFKSGASPVVELMGDVQLRPADGDARDVLRADRLAIDTEKEVAYSTSSPVQIRYGPHALTVESFRFDMSAEKLQMKSIKGKYERP
jgi:lipopolysaccharide export system protein LptC